MPRDSLRGADSNGALVPLLSVPWLSLEPFQRGHHCPECAAAAGQHADVLTHGPRYAELADLPDRAVDAESDLHRFIGELPGRVDREETVVFGVSGAPKKAGEPLRFD